LIGAAELGAFIAGSEVGKNLGEKVYGWFADLVGLENSKQELTAEEIQEMADDINNYIYEELEKEREKYGDEEFEKRCENGEYDEEWANKKAQEYIEAEAARRYNPDPLVLDIEGDGFDILDVENGVYFDEDANGIKEKTAWVGKTDALLAIDLNGDGIINDGSELFGTSTVMLSENDDDNENTGEYNFENSSGNASTDIDTDTSSTTSLTKANSGFEALAQYDENGDGIIDANDSVFSKLRLWIDGDSDGICSEGELLSLEDLGITGISLELSEEDGRRTANVIMEDGSVRKLGEFIFDAKLYDVEEDTEKIDAEIEKLLSENSYLTEDILNEINDLPDIEASGSLSSLRTAMIFDETLELKSWVEEFRDCEDIAGRNELAENSLFPCRCLGC